MIQRLFLAATAVICARVICASGPEVLERPFVDPVQLDDVLAGTFPSRIEHRHAVYPLIMYLHLKGELNEAHVRLFRSDWQRHDWRDPWRLRESFWEDLAREGYERPPAFSTVKSLFRETVVRSADGTPRRRTVRRSVDNCLEDAFDTARKTLSLRRERYGRGSVELSRWIEAQVKVFAQCSGESAFEPPAEPDPDWLPLERHDRNYQVAAAYFYDGQYLEAASRFDAIAQTPDSPWRDLARYLVPRSHLREAMFNESDREHYLNLALGEFRDLADDADYVAEFPSVPGQVSRIEALIDPVGVRRQLERQILEAPHDATRRDLIDYVYLRQAEAYQRQTEPPFGDQATEYERWSWYAADQKSAAVAVERWRTEQSLPWLYVALAQAGEDLDAATLAEILRAAEALPSHTPGYVNVLVNRIRILALLDRVDDGLRMAEDAERLGLGRSEVNRLRLAAAETTSNWQDFLRLASLKPLPLPWEDGARQTPGSSNRVTWNTTLFGIDTTRLLNFYFTPTMMLDVIDAPGLSDYQRGRMAIAAWTKAMLAGDVAVALEVSSHIRRHVPALDKDLATFEVATDRLFEAARIIFDYPAFSPWMLPGDAREPTPDHVATGWNGLNWWCAARRYRIADARVTDAALRHPRFARYSEDELAEIRKVTDALATSATTSFGPQVIRYARENLDDPRVPRTLHRLVFATRYACYTAPGEISRTAFALLHEHFPESTWAEKTPYWFDGQI